MVRETPARTVVVRREVVRPLPAAPALWRDAAEPTAPAMPARQPAPARPNPVLPEPMQPKPGALAQAWARLAECKPGTMSAFASIVAADPTNETARLGFAIAAARAGKFQQAEWAAAGVRTDAAALVAAMDGAAAVRAAAGSALERYRGAHAGAGDAPVGRVLARAAHGDRAAESPERPRGVAARDGAAPPGLVASAAGR